MNEVMDAAKHLSAPVIYPETDDLGEHETQFKIAHLLVPLIAALLTAQKRVARVSGNQFWYFAKGEPKRCRAPDVYVVDGVVPSEPDRPSWFTWEGHRPAFALEVVSGEWQKDYDDAPRDYEAMRADEVVVFDPGARPRSQRRVRWQVFRRVRGRGFVRVFAGGSDRVESRALGAWVRLVDDDGHPRLRVATGPKGDDLLPTDAERANNERAAKEAERAAKEAERAAKEAERAAKEAALALVDTERARADAAEAELARLRADAQRRRGP